MADFVETVYAVVRLSDGLVLNMVVSTSSEGAPNGCKLIEVMSGQDCGIGWYYADNKFQGPRIFAICNDITNTVVSFFSASYVSPIPTAPEGYYGVEIPVDMGCDIGWTWDGTKFSEPTSV